VCLCCKNLQVLVIIGICSYHILELSIYGECSIYIHHTVSPFDNKYRYQLLVIQQYKQWLSILTRDVDVAETEDSKSSLCVLTLAVTFSILLITCCDLLFMFSGAGL
jgi:hypothetical protein